MALRQKLLRILQEPQISGTIVLERPSTSAVAARVWPPPPSSLPSSVPSSPPSSPPSSLPSSPPAAASLPRQQGPLPQDCAVFHCRGCWAVLGDSLHLCAEEEQRLGLLVCFKVTKDVAWEESLLVGLEGPLLGCAYVSLSCRSCGSSVGLILYSASSDLAYLRGLFCFFKYSINCYFLRNQMIIEASNVNFPVVTLKQEVQQLKGKLVEFHNRIELLMKQLEELA